jgi:hypothetical protein
MDYSEIESMPQVNALAALAQTCIDMAERAKTKRKTIQEAMETMRESITPTMEGYTSVLDLRYKVERLKGAEDAYICVAKGIRDGLKSVRDELEVIE